MLTSPYATFGGEGVGGRAYGPPMIPFSLPSIPEVPGPLQLPSEDGSRVRGDWGGSECQQVSSRWLAYSSQVQIWFSSQRH